MLRLIHDQDAAGDVERAAQKREQKGAPFLGGKGVDDLEDAADDQRVADQDDAEQRHHHRVAKREQAGEEHDDAERQEPSPIRGKPLSVETKLTGDVGHLGLPLAEAGRRPAAAAARAAPLYSSYHERAPALAWINTGPRPGFA